MTQTRPLAVVTGASSGIGEEIAAQLAARGYDLALIARREDRLVALADRLRSAHGAASISVVADLASRADRDRVAERLLAESSRLEVLVNNAGFGVHGFFRETDLGRELDLIEVNCAAPVHLTKLLLPAMLERRRGFIMNVGSVGSFAPGPLMTLYYASKAFLLSFSEALWEECRDTGVVVTAVCPGPVRTGFQQAAGIAPGARSSGTTPIPVDQVVREAIDGMLRGRRVVTPGFQNKIAALYAKYAPHSRSLRTIRNIQEARRRHTLQSRGLSPEATE